MTDPDAPTSTPLSDTARLLAEAARVEAKSLGHPFVGMEHILLALLADAGLAANAEGRGLPNRDDCAGASPRAGPLAASRRTVSSD